LIQRPRGNRCCRSKWYYSEENKIFSVSNDIDGYSGGAHGNMDLAAYNYDLNTGKELKLSDLLKGNYLSF